MFEVITNNNYLLPILVSMISGSIATVGIYLFAKIAKYLRSSIFHYPNIISKLQINNIYDDFRQAEKEIYKDAVSSEKIYIFANVEPAMLCIPGVMHKLLRTKTGDIKFLLADPSSSMMKSRNEELHYPEVYMETIKTFLTQMNVLQAENKTIKIALHDESVRFKFYIFDDSIYLGLRSKDRTTGDSPLYRYRKDSPMYKCFSLQFSDYWEKYYSKDNPLTPSTSPASSH